MASAQPSDTGYALTGDNLVQESAPMTESLPRPIPELDIPMDNTLRVLHQYDKDMMTLHRQDSDEAAAEAERIAKMILMEADLPFVYRARACMILGCSSAYGYVEWAEEAVRIVKLGIEHAEGEIGDAERDLLEACEEVLKNARDDYEEHGGYEGDDNEGSEEEDETDKGLTGAETGEEMDVAETSGAAAEPSTGKKGKKSRRIDSTRDKVQEWDGERWVDIGDAGEVEV